MIISYRPTAGYTHVEYWHGTGNVFSVNTGGTIPDVTSLQEMLHDYWCGQATVTTEVGYRIYWLKAPQRATMPYVTYYVTADPHLPFAFGRKDTGQAVVRVNVYDDNKTRALRISHVVRDSINHYSDTFRGLLVEAAFCDRPQVSKVYDQNMHVASFNMLVDYDDV